MKKLIKYFILSFLIIFIFSYTKVSADPTNCFQMDFDDGGFPVHSITVNDVLWSSSSDTFDTNNGNYVIE